MGASVSVGAENAERAMRVRIDPVSRTIEVTYAMPPEAPAAVTVSCSWSPCGANDWKPARVTPLLSATARGLLQKDDWAPWLRGEILERNAAGLRRTVVFNPYPEAQKEGRVDIDFRLRVTAEGKNVLLEQVVPIHADNSDVVILDDWTKVMQKQAVVEKATPGKWQVQKDLPATADPYATGGTRLHGPGGSDLVPLTYPLSLRGTYAIFVCAYGGVRLRLSGDEHSDRLGSSLPREERLWKWCPMDWQHLIVRQNYAYTGPAATALDYIRLVPLDAATVARLEAPYRAPRDRTVVAYWEPYSYAFSDHVRNVFWHREYLDAYRQAEVSVVDMQLGRFGMKVVYETRIAEQLLYQTLGDPIGPVQTPTTTNVGRMQQYTNTLGDSLRYAREMGLKMQANFGASNCYPGSPLQGRISREHPEWMRGSTLRFEVPEVRAFALSLYRETLEIGARGVSIDFCRYPETIDVKETCNTFLRELRALADEFPGDDGEAVRILVRFPAHGVRRSEVFDYATWAREGWVDMLCPSSIQGRFHYFDVDPYVRAVAGTKCLLLPQIDALGWGLPMPGLFFWRVARLYEKGIPGIYIYQADALIACKPEMRRYARMLCRSDAIEAFWKEDARERTRCSKGIYISHPTHHPGYHGWERLHIWLEGIPMGEVEVLLDGRLLKHFAGPPYLIGDQDMSGDHAIPAGKHDMRIRARDRGGPWLERTFEIVGAG